jgi:hypothetical protein
MSDTESPSLPASKNAFSFDDTTREYLGTVQVFLSPLEATYYLPHNVVAMAPPESLGTYERARWNADSNAWEIVADYRRRMLWDTATCTPIPNTLALGDALPQGATVEPPPQLGMDAPLMNVWDAQAQAWQQLPDFSRVPVWAKATGLRATTPQPREALPDTLTVIAPPPLAVHQTAQWNAQHNGWDVVDLTPAEAPDDHATTPAPTTDEA